MRLSGGDIFPCWPTERSFHLPLKHPEMDPVRVGIWARADPGGTVATHFHHIERWGPQKTCQPRPRGKGDSGGSKQVPLPVPACCLALLGVSHIPGGSRHPSPPIPTHGLSLLSAAWTPQGTQAPGAAERWDDQHVLHLQVQAKELKLEAAVAWIRVGKRAGS